MRHSPLLLLLLAACPATADAPLARRVGTLQLEPCTLAAPGSPATVAAFCGRLAVPEDGARPGGRRIELAIALVPSRARRPQPDPVVMLAGGPGQSALEAYPTAAGAFRDVLRDRDVVLVDQRGTGGSNRLACPPPPAGAVADAFGDPAAARRFAEQCLAGLAADVRFYTTSDAVRDLEAVRAALGAAQLNLVGVSYGTRVALEYLRRHPARVRTAVLDGVVPPELALGADHARNLEAALDAHFALCEADEACRRLYGAPRARLDALLDQLRQAPQTVRFQDPLSDAPREEPLTPDSVAAVVRLYAYVPQLAAMLPRSLAEATAGRPEVLMSQAAMIQDLVGEQITFGMQLSVICSEDADRLRVDPADAGTVLGTAFVEAVLAQCGAWPRGRRPADFHAPVEAGNPVLLLSGELDPVTPPRYGDAVVRHLPNGRHLVAPGQGHNVFGNGCAPQLMGRFIAAANARDLDASCLQRLMPPPPFVGPFGWDP